MPSVMPALLTRMSRRPYRSMVVLKRSTMSASTVMSVGTGNADPPWPAISLATASRPGRLRAAITTSAPSIAKARAMARPMPLLAPVTMATRFSSCFIDQQSSRCRPSYSVFRRSGNRFAVENASNAIMLKRANAPPQRREQLVAVGKILFLDVENPAEAALLQRQHVDLPPGGIDPRRIADDIDQAVERMQAAEEIIVLAVAAR